MNDKLAKHSGHLVEGCGWSQEKPTAPGWYWWRQNPYQPPRIVSPAADLDFGGEWSGPIPLPTDAPAQGWYKAEEVDAIFNGVEVDALAIMALTRIAGFQRELIREAAQRLLDRLKVNK